jgi:hypothetical protein
MKAATSQLLLIVLIISGLHAAKIMHSASIKGVVMQDEQIKNIWAVQGNDSTVVTMEDGYFKIPVKPGMWKIIIESKDKYKSMILDKILAVEGENTDLGEINLQ